MWINREGATLGLSQPLQGVDFAGGDVQEHGVITTPVRLNMLRNFV